MNPTKTVLLVLVLTLQGCIACSGDGDANLVLSLRKQKRMILSGKSLLQQHADSRLPKQDQGRRTDHERGITTADFEKMRKEVDILGTFPLSPSSNCSQLPFLTRSSCLNSPQCCHDRLILLMTRDVCQGHRHWENGRGKSSKSPCCRA